MNANQNLREGDWVKIDLTNEPGFDREPGFGVGEVINVGARDGMIIMALGTDQNAVRPLFIVPPTKLSKLIKQ